MTRRVVAVVGATATGKTALAIALAQVIGGEIINADSRQVYAGMDIGTAKPTGAERAAVRHWLVDCVRPDEHFSLAEFLGAARDAISDIASRGLTPILAGGTGQYIWALLEGWTVPSVPPDQPLRRELEALAERDGPAGVAATLRAEDPQSADAIGPTNVRRMIRAIEVTRATGRPFSAWREKSGPPAEDVRIIGLQLPRDVLHQQIDARVDAMMEGGLVDEVRRLLTDGYSCALPAMSGIGYRQICSHLRGELSLAGAVAEIKTETHRLARMQHAWFGPADRRIYWLDAAAPDLLSQALGLVE